MAADHALAEHLAPGSAVLRLYRWDRPTLSFGRNEPAAGLYDREAAARAGVAFVRRPTGGRAVLHDEELTYAVAVHVGVLGGLRETYQTINETLVSALRALGAPAGLAPDSAGIAGPDAGPCFDAPAPGEVVAGGRKLVGSAQVRIGRTVLQHGSIILSGDQEMVARLRDVRAAPPPASLESLLGEVPPLASVELAVLDAFQSRFGGAWACHEASGAEVLSRTRLEGRYASEEWTWRR